MADITWTLHTTDPAQVLGRIFATNIVGISLHTSQDGKWGGKEWKN